MIVIPEWHSPYQLPLAAHQSPRPRDIQSVEMQALVDYMDQVGTASFAEADSVISLTLLLARTLFLQYYAAWLVPVNAPENSVFWYVPCCEP